MDLGKLYETQMSLSEWFENIGYKDTTTFRREDNEKRERLALLHEHLALPFDKQTRFSAIKVEEKSAEFLSFLETNGDKLCALRLVPKDPALAKLRMRGKTVREVLSWYKEQQIDPNQYWADFVPHAETTRWSTIFVVNNHGIFGEMIAGGHHQLTQGFYEHKPSTFSFDFHDLSLENGTAEMEKHLKYIFSFLRVDDTAIRKTLAAICDASFADIYLKGYFETVSSEDYGLWFIDYNRILGNLLESFKTIKTAGQPHDVLLSGISASPGKTSGRVKIVDDMTGSIETDEILVCPMTTPEHLPLMKQAAAIITDRGGILSHATIVSRELGKPCIVATGNATQVLHNGMWVIVDATNGIVMKTNTPMAEE